MQLFWMIAALLSAIIVWIVMPCWIFVLKKYAYLQPIREDGPSLHHVKFGTPAMAGVVIWLVWCWVSYFISYAPNALTVGLLYTATAFFLLGLYDDLLKVLKKNSYALSAKKKLFIQIAISLLLLLFLKYMGWYNSIMTHKLPFFGVLRFYDIIGISLWVFVLVASSNAINLLDGLDGLASGVSASILCGLLFCSFTSASYELNGLMLILIATILSFLWFNFKPASIIMGDSGSLFIGSVLGYIAFVNKLLFSYVIMSFVPIVTTLSVIIQVLYYKKTKKRFFKMAPLHHHYELLGIPETSIVLRYWIISIFFVVCGYICQIVFI